MILVCIFMALCIIILPIVLINFSFVEIKLKDFNFSTDNLNKTFFNRDLKIFIKLKFLNKIPIFKLKIDKEKLEKESVKNNLDKIETSLKENRQEFSVNSLELLEKLKINLNQLNLQVLIGIEDASINAIFVGLASTLISIGLGMIEQNTGSYYWKVIPLYQNSNLLKIKLDCIFSLKLMHIIYTIYILRKKGEKKWRNIQ